MPDSDKKAHLILKAQREKLGLDIKAVKDELKISLATVIALEAGDYESLPAKVFVRGYISAYCRMLEIDPTPILAEVGSDIEEQKQLDTTPTAARDEHQLNMFRIWGTLAVATIIIYLVVGNFDFGDKDNKDGGEKTAEIEIETKDEQELSELNPVEETVPVPEKHDSAVEVIEVETSDYDGAVVSNPDDIVEDMFDFDAPADEVFATDLSDEEPANDEEILEDVTTTEEEEPQKTNAEEEATAEKETTKLSAAGVMSSPEAVMKDSLHIRVTKDCWALIVDSAGEVLVHRILPARYENTLYGESPFHIRIGKAEAARLAVNGIRIDVEDNMRSSGIANFEVYAGGQVVKK